MNTFRILRRPKGFTLLEILVSVAIFAVITLGVTSTMQQTNRLTQKLKHRQATVSTGINGMSRFHHDLQLAYSERLQKSPTFFKCRQVGDGYDCSFTYVESTLEALFNRRTNGTQIARYWTVKDDELSGTYQLLRSEVPLQEIEYVQVRPGQVVARGILKIEMEFYQSENDQWLKEWDTANPGTSRFPKAVRLVLETVDPEAPREDWKEKSLRFQTATLLLNEWEDR